jgi:hypothetical protein
MHRKGAQTFPSAQADVEQVRTDSILNVGVSSVAVQSRDADLAISRSFGDLPSFLTIPRDSGFRLARDEVCDHLFAFKEFEGLTFVEEREHALSIP